MCKWERVVKVKGGRCLSADLIGLSCACAVLDAPDIAGMRPLTSITVVRWVVEGDGSLDSSAMRGVVDGWCMSLVDG